MIMNGVARFLLCEGFDGSILRLYRHFRLRFALAIETSGPLGGVVLSLVFSFNL